MKFALVIFLAILALSAWADPLVTLSVELTPAGSYQAVSKKLKGNLIKKDGAFSSDKLSVSIESFQTGIDLRDEHMWKHMNSSKHPKAVLSDLKAQGGKGQAMLEVNGVKKPVSITYEEKGQEVEAQFSVKASDFSIPKATYLGVGVSDLIKVQTVMPFVAK